MKTNFLTFGVGFLSLAIGGGVSSSLAQSVEKEIPIEKIAPSQTQVIAYNQGGISFTIDPATAQATPMEGGLTKTLQQQMRFVMTQALAPWLTLAYGAGVGFRTQEVQLLRQEDQASAYLNLLNRPALTWKPRDGIEIEAAYQTQQNLSSSFTEDHNETATLQGKAKISPQSTLGAAYASQQFSGINGDESSIHSVRVTSEYVVANSPITLQLNPGYEESTAVDGTDSIRGFVENAVIWKVDTTTTLTLGSGFAGGGSFGSSQTGYMLIQHVVLPGTAFEMRAAILNAERNMPGEGFAISAGPTVALAQALSAGLSVRYKMDQNPVDRPKNETFLSLSINGRF